MSGLGRNDLCPCGSGKKYKKCCLNKAQAIEHADKHFLIELIPEVDEICDEAFDDIENGNLESAENKAMYLDQLYPNHHKVKFLQGVCLIQRGNLKESIDYFEKAIQIYPYFSEAYYNLGCVYRKNTMVSKAVAYFRQVIKFEGNSDIGQMAKKELDSLEKAISQGSGKSLDVYLEQEKLFNKAYAFLRDKKHERAISLFEQVLVRDPDHVQSYGNMGITYGMLGDREKAFQCFDKALSLDSDYVPAKVNKLMFERLLNSRQSVDDFNIEALEIRYYQDVFRDSKVHDVYPNHDSL